MISEEGASALSFIFELAIFTYPLMREYINLKEESIMKRYFKDYGELCKQTGAFYKKHWLGTIIMNIVVFICSAALFWPKWMKKELVDNVKSVFKKEKEED